MDDRTARLMDAALRYAARGWKVIPAHTPTITDDGVRCSCSKGFACKSPGKHPRTRWDNGPEEDRPSSDLDQIRRWWTTWPDANIAILAGPRPAGSGLWVLDFDEDLATGKQGLLVRKHMGDGEEEIGGRVLATGRGVHHVFEWSDGSPATGGSDFASGVDVRSSGQIFIVPPSLHYRGVEYLWEDDDEAEAFLEPAPGWVLEWVETNRPGGRPRASLPGPEPSGPLFGLSPPAPGGGATAAPGAPGGARALTPQAIGYLRAQIGHIDPDPRDNWLKVGFALHETGWGEQAYRLWTGWSQTSTKFDPDDQRETWGSFARGYTGPRITMGTLVQMAKGGGWRSPAALTFEDDGSGDEPVPFSATTRETGPPIAVDDVFGACPRMAGYLERLADSLQVPPDVVAMTHLVGISAMLAKRVEIECPQWKEPPQLWYLCLMPSGSRKTPMVRCITDPIERAANSHRAREVVSALATQHQEIEDQIEQLRLRSDAVRGGGLYEEMVERGMTVESALAELEDQRVALGSRQDLLPLRIDYRGLLIDDTTEAAMQTRMKQTRGNLFVCGSETTPLTNAINPSWSSNGTAMSPQVDTWLKAYSGDTVRFDRVSRGSAVFRNASISVCLVVQDGEPTNYLFNSPALRQKGFMGRFLVHVPEFDPSSVDVEAPLPPDRRGSPWAAMVEHLVVSPIANEPQLIRMHGTAREAFQSFRRGHLREFRPGGKNIPLAEFHNKAHGTVARLAGSLAFARAFEAGSAGAILVTHDDISRAIRLFGLLTTHTEVAHGLEDSERSRNLRIKLLRAAARHWPRGAFSRREVARKVYEGGSTTTDQWEALERLVEDRWLVPASPRDENLLAAGNSRARFRLNPSANPMEIPDA